MRCLLSHCPEYCLRIGMAIASSEIVGYYLFGVRIEGGGASNETLKLDPISMSVCAFTPLGMPVGILETPALSYSKLATQITAMYSK